MYNNKKIRVLSININYNFSLQNIKDLRKKFSLKICYKKKYNFLNLKYTPSQALSCRLTKRGNFLKTYRLLKNFYYIHLLKKKKTSINRHNNFLFLYKTYTSFKDFDRVLFWKYKSLNCLFNYKVKKFRKKKRKINTIKFTFKKKRLLLTLNFIKCLILLDCKRGNKKMQFKLFEPLYDFIINDKSNLTLKVKLKIYKLKLAHMY